MSAQIAALIVSLGLIGLPLVWLVVLLLRWREHRRLLRQYNLRQAPQADEALVSVGDVWQPALWFRARAAWWAFRHAKELDAVVFAIELNSRHDPTLRPIFDEWLNWLPKGWHR